ncbi:MAG: WD40 repeat domain-containing protein, partial [Planctomycetes bacterium]|nr:WD40 repeat domain-containing protein [Planctomycetota bacterium]
NLLKAWINGGAKGPKAGPNDPYLLVTPKVKPIGTVRQPISAVDHSPDGKWIAVARYGAVEILSAGKRKVVRKLTGHSGNVNDLGFSRDGKFLFVAAGEASLFGEATLWETSNWKRLRVIKGHNDSLYAAKLSPDGSILATGSYDQKIILWERATGEKLKELTGHNGSIFDLAFHPNGKILASASGDRTVKLWDVSTGKRLDTLIHPEKGQYAVAFSPNGRYVVAGGVDNRIRVWAIQKMGEEGTNPILYSRFAHEAAIIQLQFSPDGKTLVSSGEDRTVKLWDTQEFSQRSVLTDQSDWVTALSVAPGSQQFLAGRLDGTLSAYSLKTGSEEITDVANPITSLPVPQPHGQQSVGKLATVKEIEPNESPTQAMVLTVPATVDGILWQGLQSPSESATPDVDLYRFRSKAGRTWIIETNAARQKSPADTKIEVLHADGKPVLRFLLRAVRDSSITFRPINSTQNQARVTNWREMELNQFLYMGGEICKLYRMPRGPDSGFQFYTINGKRKCYFGTSGTVHALDDPAYIVEPYPPGTQLADNGLPVFRLYYANEDDGDRKLGNDSRLVFTAPQDGEYLVKVTDVRGFGGKDFRYSLTVREPKPDFNVTLKGKNAKIGAGSGQRLVVSVDRIDGFNGEVRVDITGIPEGFHVSSPIVVQAGHLNAQGVINVDPDVKPTLAENISSPKNAKSKKKLRQPPPPPPLPEPLYLIDWSKLKITATANIHGRKVVKDVGDLGIVNVLKKPNLIVHLEQDPNAKPTSNRSDELVIAPGTTITAMLWIERHGFDGELKFDMDNLPHGVIVDNIGLSGILIRKGETHRQISITASDWVPETTRLIHAVGQSAGKQASRPIVLHVRKPNLQVKK